MTVPNRVARSIPAAWSPGRSLVRLGALGPFRNALLRRGFVVWLYGRLAMAWAGILDPGLAVEVTLLPVVGVAVWLDARRRAEDVFLGNLGIPGWAIAVYGIPLALVAEALVP